MGEMRNRTEQLQELKRLIAEWNASRLDMFAISEPNEDLEYRGAMRFYFQDSGSKVATKCVRFTSMDNTGEVTKVLVEKFHPDMKMLSNPSYSLYEVHQNKESRKLRPDEYPLRIQLEWQNNDREGRFLLVSDADKIVHSNLFETSKIDRTENTNLKRSLSRREKKQLKKKREEEAKKAAENKKTGKDDIAAQLYDEIPETSFTRSISNPEAVMRRRRQQKIEKRLKDFQSKDAAAGGTLKIFATTLKPEIPYKTLLVSVDDNTIHVIKEALIKYQMEQETPDDYCLIMVNIPPEGQNTSATIGKERVVHDEDCPLKIAVTWPPSRGTVVFHLRRRANLPQIRHERKRSKSPARKSVDRSPEKAGGENIKQQSIPEHLLPYLQELSSDGMDPSHKPRIHRLQMNVTEVGSEKSMSAGGNYLVLHAPHILQRHCVITNMDGRVSVTPSSGDAEVSVNGKRFYETTAVMHNDVIKIGRVHTFRFCDPAFEKPSRHSAPVGYPDDGSLSSSSDMEGSRRRPNSLVSPTKSSYNSHHHSNDYPSSHNIQDHDDKNPGMFETTFDVTGEVTTYSGRTREPESPPPRSPPPRSPPPRSPPPRTPTETSFAHEDLYDDKLPATLEFLETGEDAFFAAVVSEVNGQAVHFKLAPTYTLYMCARFRMSPAYRPELNNHQRGERLGVTLLKIANMARSTIRDNSKYPGSLAFWMANCSELLHFIKQDRDISPYTKEGQPHGQQVLAQSVHQAFRDFVRCAQNELRTVMSAFIDPTDGADMEDSDLDSLNEKDADSLPEHSDGRSYHVYGPDGTLSGNDSWFGGRRTQGRATISEVIFNLSSTMSLLRRCRVNAALTIQVFSQLFHFINTWLFNKLVLEPKLGLCTKDWGRRISKRLARVEKWAEKQGLELAADCHLCRIAQAAHLLQAPKNSSSDVDAISMSCFKLNSQQVRTLLENYRPGPDEYIQQDLVETMVMAAEENADEVARSNGLEIQLEEDWELQLPFLLPEDGYSCEVIRGVPPGLKGFLEPLAKTGLCKLTLQPETSGLWTVYLKKYEKLSLDIANTPQYPEIEEIAFNKGRGGMGLSIVAAKGTRQDKLGIYIKQVVKDGPASKDGRLRAGDQILSVNGESLIGVTQERAAEVMVKSGPNVSLKILKQGAIYHGLATLLTQSPTKDSPQRLTPLEPEDDIPQSSPTLPDDNVPGFLPRHNSTTMQEERFIDDRRRSEVEERLKEEQRLRDEKDKLFREEEEERLREEEDLRELERLKEEERLIEEKRQKEEEEERDEQRRKEEQQRIEEERARQEEERRLYEERRRVEEEEERAREEEQRRLEEQRAREAERQRQIKLEEERRRRDAEEDEKFRIQEDRIRKRMEEERRIIEEERRKLVEERRLLEEERKKEEERKRSEQQRILDEQRRLEEEKKRIEEEKKRQLREADERRRAEEERRRLQEEEEEEEAQIIAEEQRRRQELLRREEFRRREDQRRIAEERKRAEEEDRRLANEPQKPRSRRIRFEDEVMPQVKTVEQQPPQFNFQPELNTKREEVVEEEPVVVRGRLTEADINNMNSVFERLEDEQPKDEPPRSPIRVDTRDTRYGRAIVITQGMIQTAQSPTLPTQPEQRKPKEPEEKKETEFERWQRQQRELAERREREEEEREQRLQEERTREERERREREEQERLQREEQERQRTERERQREQFERQERVERERRQREEREREERERQEREEHERREREERERIDRERQEQEQRIREERERRDQERKDRMQRAKLEREQREREEEERKEREKQEAEREKREQEEWEKGERERELERQRKEQQALMEKNKQQDQHRERLDADRERLRVIERERKMLYPDDLESSRTLDYIESMSEDEVEREFQRRLEAEKKRKSDYQDRRAGGLVSVTRVTYHPDRNDQSERDRRLQMILQEQRMLDKDRKRDESRDVQLKREDDETRRNIQSMRDEAERKLQEEHQEDRRKQQLELQRKIEEQNILREKENEARRQLQEEQRRRPDRGSDSDHVMELKERALRDYERRRGLIDLEITKQQANLKFQDEIHQKEIDEVKAKFDQQRPVSALKTTNGTKPKKQVSFSQMSTEIREPASPTYVVESSSGYTAKITPAASVRLVETRPPAIHTPPDSPLSSPADSPPNSPRDYPPIPRPPPPLYDDNDPPPLPPPPYELLEDDEDDFPPPPKSPLNDRSSSSSSEPRSPVNNYSAYSSNHSGRNNVASGYGTYPRAARPMSYPAPADLDSIQLSDSLKYSGSNNNIIAMNSGIRQTRSLGRIPASGGNPPPIPKKPEQLGFKDKMKLFNQDKTPESKVTTSRWQREQFGVNGDITYT